MKNNSKYAGHIRVNDDLSDQELSRLCDLIELLDRWDRESSTDQSHIRHKDNNNKSISL